MSVESTSSGASAAGHRRIQAEIISQNKPNKKADPEVKKSGQQEAKAQVEQQDKVEIGSKNPKKSEQSEEAQVKRQRYQDHLIEKAAKGRKEKVRSDDSDAAEKPAPESSPTKEAAPTKETVNSGSKDVKALASQYVSQYEKQSGHQLSTTEHDQKVQEVADFYSKPERSDRLEKVVFDQAQS